MQISSSSYELLQSFNRPASSSRPPSTGTPEIPPVSEPGPSGPSIPPVGGPTPAGPTPASQICSTLPTGGLDKIKEIMNHHRDPFVLALNITGSFEGASGWNNIAGDFDQMGMSLGLFQQNLGQGSLQPLLISLKNQYGEVLAKNFTTAQLALLQQMLNDWRSRISFMGTGQDEALSPLDMDYEQTSLGVSSSPEIKSVQWARQNILTPKGDIQPHWKTSFRNMAATSEYISIQGRAALSMHNKVLDYMQSLHLKEVRSYLFLFDIVVQNGGFYKQNLLDYAIYLKNNPTASELNKLQKLLALRLVHVRPEYVADVMSRKNTLIDGVGTVHGGYRQLEKQYCFNRRAIVGP